jgi:hypothetical protein
VSEVVLRIPGVPRHHKESNAKDLDNATVTKRGHMSHIGKPCGMGTLGSFGVLTPLMVLGFRKRLYLGVDEEPVVSYVCRHHWLKERCSLLLDPPAVVRLAEDSTCYS